jgi:REP element-mobilizing transposase RayT
LLKDEEDFITACNFIAIVAWKLKVDILAFIVMSNHLHTLIASQNRSEAKRFIRLLKQEISTYLKNKYGTRHCFEGVSDSISLVDSEKYLQNCIAYILRNAICAKICKKLEAYPWSSYSSYFNKHSSSKLRTVASLGIRERRRLLKSRLDLRNAPFTIDENGRICNQSFVRFDIVEKAFHNSGKMFLSFLGRCNDAQMEYEFAVKPQIRIDDYNLVATAEKLVGSWFNGKALSELTTSEKCRIVKNLFFNNKTTIPQLSRILGLPRELITQVLST